MALWQNKSGRILYNWSIHIQIHLFTLNCKICSVVTDLVIWLHRLWKWVLFWLEVVTQGRWLSHAIGSITALEATVPNFFSSDEFSVWKDLESLFNGLDP